MMDYDHSPHSYNAVKNIKTPQSVGVDAASSVTKNGRFCGVGQQFDILIHNSFTPEEGFPHQAAIEAGDYKERVIFDV
ncbi:hypothetical protein IMSHALPRED_001271 [Imshaugia aleurites]|uniref:Uncharacterized protein n=1 Tax=Imshaugia aleurites TaxID=172621 RepID=A0A8H3J280_9LECA|nr:hypothetical protein IMSHALPRED_001271 [Imshaugia aleurites]